VNGDDIKYNKIPINSSIYTCWIPGDSLNPYH